MKKNCCGCRPVGGTAGERGRDGGCEDPRAARAAAVVPPSTTASPTTRASTPTTAARGSTGVLRARTSPRSAGRSRSIRATRRHRRAPVPRSARRRRRRRPASTSCSRSTRGRRVAHDPAAFCPWAALVANTVKEWGIHDFIVWNEPNTSLYWSPQDAQLAGRVRGAARVLLRLDPRCRLERARDRVSALSPALERQRADRADPVHPRRRRGVQGLRPDDADHGSDVDPSVPEPEQPDRLARRRLLEPGLLRRSEPRPREAGDLRRLQRHGAADDAQRADVPHRRARLADRHDRGYPAQYFNQENVAVVSEQTQANYVRQAVQKYLACDPTVTDVEWFLLVDEATRNGKDAAREDDRRRLAERPAHRRRRGRVDAEARSTREDAPLFAEGRAACTGGWSTGRRRPPARRRPRRPEQAGEEADEGEAKHGSLDTNTCSLYHGEHMFGKLLILALVAAFAVGLAARSSHGAGPERTYVVRPADTLWSIAARTYGGDPRAGRLAARAAEPPGVRDAHARVSSSSCPG